MAHDAARERGRDAEHPGEIPKPGWRDIALRVKHEIAEDRLSIISAGVAFYALLAAFPALGAMVAIYGLVFDPRQAIDQVASMAGLVPPQAVELVVDQLVELAQADRAALGIGAAGALLLALWSASVGMRTLMQALNVAYDEREKRGFFKRAAISLLLTTAAIVGGLVAIGAIVLLPAVIRVVGLGPLLEGVVYYARWPILAGVFWLGLGIVYRYGPSRDEPRWSWVNHGAILVTVLWLAGSALFSWYVENFGNYNKTYGSMGAVVILLLWLLLSAYAVLVGAEINAETERQTRKDSTVGEPQPIGRRRAHAADTVGRSP